MNSFICINCKKEVTTGGHIGTHQRNHCPFCLYSKHVDITPGDRKATCKGDMMPIGLTFKHEGQSKIGEIMLVHACSKCGKIGINRLAGDDDADKIMEVFQKSLRFDDVIRQKLKKEDVILAEKKDEREIEMQLFGN